ncbi:hypothetical protein HZP32_14190 [Elizabethkingia anophelis]|nr:hypothetical protein [Elizabethkingia anophelis]
MDNIEYIKRGILSAGVLFLLGSCRGTDTENSLNTGSKASVKINLVGASFKEDVTTQASSGSDISGLRSVKVQHSGVLLSPSAYVGVELSPESPSGLKAQASSVKNMLAAAGSPLGNGIKFRVLAYKVSDGSYVGSMDYTVGSAGSALVLDAGVPYTIVCYSYGSSSLPTLSSSEQLNLSGAVVNYDDTNRDFLYQRQSYTPGSSNNTLNITLNHQVSRITTVVRSFAPYGNINSIANAKLTPHYSDGVINLSGGVITGRSVLSSGAVLDFSGAGFPTANATSSPVFINSDSGGATTGVFSADINIGGVTKTITLSNKFKITPGSDSTLGITFNKCGAYIGPSSNPANFKAFMCHNLGADTTQDPFTPNALIHGAKYQWGANTNEAGSYYSQSDDQSNSGNISGWNSTAKANGSWSDASKTANDPCPSGYRVPTSAQWQAVIANNTKSFVGSSWSNSPTNYGTGVNLGGVLFLPAAGYRFGTDGTLRSRGFNGLYWGSSETTSSFASNLSFSGISVNVNSSSRLAGFSVRCIAL